MTNVLTGGIVSVEDGTKKSEEYAPPRKVRVELHFTLPEGTADGQTFLNAVASQADAKVRELLGQKPVAAVVADPKATETPPATPRRGPGRPTAATAERAITDKDKLAEAAGVAAEVKGKDAPKPDPAAIVDDETPAAVEEEDPFSVPAAEEVKPISDEELNSLVGKKHATLQKPPLIRDLVGTFKPEGWTKQFTIRDIPQAQRPDFLKKLAELK